MRVSRYDHSQLSSMLLGMAAGLAMRACDRVDHGESADHSTTADGGGGEGGDSCNPGQDGGGGEEPDEGEEVANQIPPIVPSAVQVGTRTIATGFTAPLLGVTAPGVANTMFEANTGPNAMSTVCS